MTELVVACATFVALHLLVSGTAVRGAVTSTIGEGPYTGLFSLASLASVVWMSAAYSGLPPGDNSWLWATPEAWVWVGLPVNLVALVLVFLGLTTPNPTLAQMEFLLEKGDPVKGIVRVSRHPMLMGLLLWSSYHAVANGDAASLVFFGTFIVTTALGPRAIDAKRKRKLGARWAPFSKKTSIIPFVAIAQGRNQFVPSEIGVGRLIGGVALFVGFLVAHRWLFGVAVVPG